MARSRSESHPVKRPREERDPQKQDDRRRQDELLDEALDETFPASDPIAPATNRDADANRV